MHLHVLYNLGAASCLNTTLRRGTKQLLPFGSAVKLYIAYVLRTHDDGKTKTEGIAGMHIREIN